MARAVALCAAAAAAAPPPAPPPPPSPLRRACMQRCSDAGHCCTGSVGTNNLPSCGQGCLVAEYYASPEGGSHTGSDAVKQCQKQCGNQQGKKYCKWNKQGTPKAFANFTNCAPNNRCPRDDDVSEDTRAACNAQDGANGRECKAGCQYFLNPRNPVCAQSAGGHACVNNSAPDGFDTASTATKAKNNVKDWIACAGWCQNQRKKGCCAYTQGAKECIFAEGPAPVLMTGVTGSQAALCAPFALPAVGGHSGGGGVTGGGVFLILFFVGGATYFAAGFAYMWHKHGERGVEAIPHKDFWIDLPHLIKDGAVFAKVTVQDKVESLRNGYSSV